MLSRRSMILGGTAAAGVLASRSPAIAEASASARNLLLVVVSGGWDTTYALDPKPGLSSIDAPDGDVQSFEGIPIFASAARPAASAFFAAHAGITTLVNGLQVQSLVHTDCAKRVLTGTASDTAPDIGAITAHELGRDLPAPYLVLGQTSYSGPYASIAARAGTANQIGTLLDPLYAFPTAEADFTPRFIPTHAEDALVRAHVQARAERERAQRGGVGPSAARLQDFLDSRSRGDALAAAADFGDFTYTRDLVVQAGIALDVLQQGLSRVVQLEIAEFDTHEGNERQAVLQEALFSGLLVLVDELTTRSGRGAGNKLVDETVVVVVSEMGRTPKLNDALGKDHWPVTSALVIGGGATGGRVIGATDDALLARAIDFDSGQPVQGGLQISYANFAAGLLALVGVDPAAYMPEAEPLHALCT